MELEELATQLHRQRMRGKALDPEVEAEMISSLVDGLENRINRALLEHLPQSQMAAFERLLDDENADTEAFLRRHLPNMDGVVAGAILEYQRSLGL